MYVYQSVRQPGHVYEFTKRREDYAEASAPNVGNLERRELSTPINRITNSKPVLRQPAASHGDYDTNYQNPGMKAMTRIIKTPNISNTFSYC